MTEENHAENVGMDAALVTDDESLFPTLDLIADQFVNEDGIDFEGLTTLQLLQASREAFLMHHQAMQEMAASLQTLGMFLGHLDDRVETLLAEDVPPAKPLIVLPKP